MTWLSGLPRWAPTRVEKVTTITAKAEREAATDEVTATIVAQLSGEFEGREKEIKAAVRSLTKQRVRQRIASTGVRIDGRGPTDIRPVSAQVGIIPTAHGSGLFQRGETQVLNITTLGMPRMDQMLDTIGIDEKKRYMHHYNMPPYANGETGRVGSPKRREIGHGLLAERALLPVVPPIEEFPYALRLVSEVLASNGSTSMASVCASSLSLMDAGVPIKAPVGGIAMGLVKVDDRYITLTDILGAEDAFGDMDFKVAGTAEFVTALQLDTKIDGLPADVLASALQQARDARIKILAVMAEAISEPRADVRETAPKIVSLEIPIDKIGEVIGPKGKVINALQQETGTDIAVDDDGRDRDRDHRRQGRRGGGRGPAAHRDDPRPAQGRGGRRLHRQGGQHHQVRRLRQHPSRPRRPGPYLEARPGQADRQGRGRRRSRRRDRGPGG